MKKRTASPVKIDLYTVTQYGHIKIDLKKVMDEKNISRNALARAIDARFEVIDKWYDGHMNRIDADVLARICYALDCTPNDIIRYVPPAKDETK